MVFSNLQKPKTIQSGFPKFISSKTTTKWIYRIVKLQKKI